MPGKPRKIQWNEQKKLIAAVSAGVVLLIVAALLPLAFRHQAADSGSQETATTALESKAAVFADYWNDGGDPVEIEKLERPGSKTASFCLERMAGLIALCIDDKALEDPQPTGSEYTVVSQGKTELRLCRMWMEAQGDWHNWMDVCFDAESGEIYYLYVSRECLTNRDLYQIASEEKPTVEKIADQLALSWNSRLRHVQKDALGVGTAVLSSENGTLAFEISCISYDALVDIKIRCI